MGAIGLQVTRVLEVLFQALSMVLAFVRPFVELLLWSVEYDRVAVVTCTSWSKPKSNRRTHAIYSLYIYVPKTFHLIRDIILGVGLFDLLVSLRCWFSPSKNADCGIYESMNSSHIEFKWSWSDILVDGYGVWERNHGRGKFVGLWHKMMRLTRF